MKGEGGQARAINVYVHMRPRLIDAPLGAGKLDVRSIIEKSIDVPGLAQPRLPRERSHYPRRLLATSRKLEVAMPDRPQIHGEVNSKADLGQVFEKIRKDVEKAGAREDLTELYKRAGYLITLTYAPSWREKFGTKAAELRRVAEAEFATTARKINRRAKEVGTEADYDEKWGR